MNKVNLKNIVWKEGKYYVAWNINTSISSFGKTKKEAIESLEEALQFHFEEEPKAKINKVERLDVVPFTLKYA